MSYKKSKGMVFGLTVLLSGLTAGASPTITDVTAQQRYPWNGKVDITYAVSGDIAAYALTNGLITAVRVTAKNLDSDKTYEATALSGDTDLTDGPHKLVWDLDAQGLKIKSANVVFNVACETNAAMYCVIDISGGVDAKSYPVSYLSNIPGGSWSDEYKKTKLVLRRIQEGAFIMGDDQANESHRVRLTRPFYMGVFEVTQKQWALVTGGDASDASYGKDDMVPALNLSYDTICSAFIAKLQSKTGLDFGLPTEAQWEYSCRAGTVTTYYWGDVLDSDYASYSQEWGVHYRTVGIKIPNAWGLYDMIGNIAEFCLDWYGDLPYGTDPQGPAIGSYRVLRGGHCGQVGTSSYRSYGYPKWHCSYGFRLSRTLP